MSDNGNNKSIEMVIRVEEGKGASVSFPKLDDKVLTYGFLKLGEKTLDKHYEQMEKSSIIQPKGGIMNFARNKK